MEIRVNCRCCGFRSIVGGDNRCEVCQHCRPLAGYLGNVRTCSRADCGHVVLPLEGDQFCVTPESKVFCVICATVPCGDVYCRGCDICMRPG